MPVHKAGSRLYHSVPFKHLAKGGAGATARSSNVSLNLTPFVDMMTILVTFLLIVFSTSGELIKAQKNLELPTADTKEQLQEAPIITITRSDLSFQGNLVATVEGLLKDENPQMKIEALFLKLDAFGKKTKEALALGGKGFDKKAKKACDDAKAGIIHKEFLCPEGLVILQADEDTDARIITMVVTTAKYANFDNVMFAVKKK
ncbi:MAG: biopolymer transporter ExbD [Kofleriaceae bacterium]